MLKHNQCQLKSKVYMLKTAKTKSLKPQGIFLPVLPLRFNVLKAHVWFIMLTPNPFELWFTPNSYEPSLIRAAVVTDSDRP